MKTKKPTAIDLFSGAGCLSLGLKKAGFEVVAGVEIDKEIAETYRANHRNTKLLTKDIRNVTGKEILKLIGNKEIDLITGCPPCQGFSQLTEKYKRRDSRNYLVLEMARLIEEIKPKMVMMENVAGITTRGKSILDKFVKRLTRMGYVINMNVLQMADYGIPQSRRRFVLLAGKGFDVSLPKPTHSRQGDLKRKLKPWITISKVIRNLKEPVKLSFALENGGPEKFNWNIIRDLKKISIDRLKAIKEGDSRLALPKKLRPKCHKNRNRGFQNVYGRLRWDEVSSTITTGCSTPCMGRFGHPSKHRTISIREAALIQTFPMNYKFKTKYMDVACNLVGNAFPYKFAHIAAKKCLNILSEEKEFKNGR